MEMIVNLKAIALSAAVAVLAATSANATPISSAKGLQKPADGVELAAVRKKVIIKRDRVGPRPFKYRPGYRYRNAPPNWSRYDGRPGDWRTRGCVIVGPVWFCP